MVFQISCLCDKNKLQAARGHSWELILISWTRSFTVSETESGPISKDYSLPSLETEQIMFLYCRLKVYKKRLENKFWSTKAKSTRLCHKWKFFALLGLVRVCLNVIGGEIFSVNEMFFHFRSHDWSS